MFKWKIEKKNKNNINITHSNHRNVMLKCLFWKFGMRHKMLDLCSLSRFTSFVRNHHIISHHEPLKSKKIVGNWNSKTIISSDFHIQWAFPFGGSVPLWRCGVDQPKCRHKCAQRIDFAVIPSTERKTTKNYPRFNKKQCFELNNWNREHFDDTHLTAKFADFRWSAANNSKISIHTECVRFGWREIFMARTRERTHLNCFGKTQFWLKKKL